jgi:hypothetical protein
MLIKVTPKNEEADAAMADVFTGKHRAWILRNMGTLRLTMVEDHLTIVIKAIEQTPVHYLNGAQKKQCFDTVATTLERIGLKKESYTVELI